MNLKILMTFAFCSWMVNGEEPSVMTFGSALRITTAGNGTMAVRCVSRMGLWKWMCNVHTHEANVTTTVCIKMMPDGGWANVECNRKLKYICQKDPEFEVKYKPTFTDSPKKTFSQAKYACIMDENSFLVDIKSAAMNELIIKGLSAYENKRFWTSGNDKEEEGTWKWGDGTLIDPKNNGTLIDPKNKAWIKWGAGKDEPNGKRGENCLSTYSKNKNEEGWIDDNCNFTRGYICQKKYCDEHVCLNRGNCSISGTGFRCACMAGSFGRKCEKDLVEISSKLHNITALKGQNVSVDLTLKSYDGNIVLSTQNLEDRMKSNKLVFIPHGGAEETISLSLGIQMKDTNYCFVAAPQSNPDSYSRALNLSLFVSDFSARHEANQHMLIVVSAILGSFFLI